MSGRVTLEADSLTDYVIYDGKSPSQLLDRLGIRAFSDLPARTVCVRWDWVATCKRNASFMRALIEADRTVQTSGTRILALLQAEPARAASSWGL